MRSKLARLLYRLAVRLDPSVRWGRRQTSWGLDYIKTRYGTSEARARFARAGWYGGGR